MNKQRFKNLLIALCAAFIIIFLAFHAITGHFLVWLSNTDFWFHSQRATEPLCFLTNDCHFAKHFYTPLFHITIYLITLITKNQIISLSLFLPVLYFVLLPYAVYRLAKTYWMDEKMGIYAGLIYLFGIQTTLTHFIGAGTYAHPLSTLFLLLGLEAMVSNLQTGKGSILPFLWGIPAMLSHMEGGGIYLFALMAWSYLKKSYYFIYLILLIALFAPLDPYLNALKMYRVSIVDAMIIFLFVLNPIVMYLANKGIMVESGKERTLLLSMVAVCFLFAWIDPLYRPFVNAGIILTVFAGGGLFYCSGKRRAQIGEVFLFTWLMVLAGVVYVAYKGNLMEIAFNTL